MMGVAHGVTIQPAGRVRGRLRIPGDKSISHRYALLSALSDGRCILANYAPGADCASTLRCLQALGVPVMRQAPARAGGPPDLVIDGRGVRGLSAAPSDLDCGNSGSTMRMLAGVVAAHSFDSILTGDDSLSRRPMRRVVTPLSLMGARILTADGARPPVTITGADLAGIDFVPDVPSAQVKSAVLLAGLQASGRTTVTEPSRTRDHTERALLAFGASVDVDDLRISIDGGQRLRPLNLEVPGDISSAAFPAVAAAALEGSEVHIDGVGLNPSRTGILSVLRRFGAEVSVVADAETNGEPMGSVTVRHGQLRTVVITPAEVPDLIDELPVLAALATFGGGLQVTGAGELRVKESDRISSLVAGLRAMGADCDELPDGFIVRASRRLTGGRVHAEHDHRLAMAFAVAALGASGPTHIEGADAVAVSYPSFFDDLDRLRA